MPLYAIAGALLLGGLAGAPAVAAFQGLELLGLALIAADAWGVRQRIPVLSSSDKAVAAGGWVLLVLGAMALALALPVL